LIQYQLKINLSRSGHAKIVKILLKNPKVDPSYWNNDAIISACKKGHTKVVKLLLKDHRVDPGALNNRSICYASQYGHTKIVKILLQDARVDPSGSFNSAICAAVQNCKLDIVKLLLKDSRVDGSVPIKFVKNATRSSFKILIEDESWGFSNYENLYRKYHPEITEDYLKACKEKEDKILCSVWSMKQSKNQWKDILYVVGDMLKHTDVIYN